MKNSTFSAQVANNLLTLLQGYSKTIRLLLVMLLTLTASTTWGAEVTYTVSSTSAVTKTGTAPAGSSATYTSTYTTKCQLIKDKSMTLTLSGYDGCKITGLTLSMKSNKSAGAGNMSMKIGATTISSIATANFNNATWNGAYSQSYVDVTPSVTATTVGNGQNIVITIAATVNSLYCESFTLTYTTSGGGATTPTQLAAPTGLTANNITSSGATLSWNAVANASSYTLQVYGENDDVIAEYTGLTQTTKEVSGLEPKTYYVWGVTAIGNGTTYEDSNEETAEFTTSAAAGGDGGKETWTLVTNASNLEAGDQIVIAAKDYNCAISTTQNNNNRGQATITKSGDNITFGSDVQILTLEAGTKSSTFGFNTGSGYLYASSSSGNQLKTQATNNDNGSWSISISSGTATIKANGTNSRNIMQYNQSSSLFACYGSASQKALAIYKKVTSSGGDDPEPVIVKTLKSIAVTGMTTTFEQGDVFKFDGTCTATYSVTKDGAAQADETAEVTPTNVSTPDMNQIGTQTVYVTYSEGGVEKTDDYKITITENTVTAGEYCITPNNEFWGTNFNGSLSGEALNQTYTGRQDDITIQYAKGSSQYMYINDSQTRVYGNNSLTFSVPSSYVITAIAFTADGNNWNGTHTSNVGSMTDSKNWEGSAKEVTITFGGNCRITKICVTYEELDLTLPSAPTFNPEAGTYNAVQNVTISAEAGTTIYYTLDGTDPTTASDVYASAIEISETTTVKAIAVKDEKVSPVATATYTINLPLTTMDQIFAKATAVGSTATSVEITFGNWVVTGVKGSNAYLTDGTKGLIIYTASHGFVVGDVLSGTVACKVQLYNGSSELTELVKTTEGLTVTTGGTVTPVVVNDVTTLNGVNTGSVIKITGPCTVDGSNYYVAGVQLYNSLFAYTNPEDGYNYECTGIYLQYNTTKEILPRKAEDLVKIVTQQPAGIKFETTEYTANVGEAFETPVLTNPNGLTVTYSTSDASKATVNATTGTVTIVAEGIVTITATFEGNASYNAGTASYTITISDPSKLIAELPFNFNGGREDIESKNGMSQSGLGTDYNSDLKLKFDNTGDWVVIRFNSEPEKLSYDIKNNSFSGGTFSVQESADGETYTDVAVYTTIEGTQNEEYILLPNSRYVKFIYTEKTTGNVGLGNIKITKPDLRQEAGIAWSTESVEITVGEDFTPPTLSNPNSVSGITYESSNTDVATVNNAGVITLKKSVTGTAIITATFAGNEDYKPAEVSCTITVNALYTVTLNPNYPAGKTGTFKDKEGNTVNGNLVISLPEGTKKQPIADLYSSISLDGYIFEGWYEAADGDAHRENTGDISKDITFYAHWKVPYTVTFITGTSTTIEPITETTADGIKLPAATLVDCSNWGFLGWAEAAIESETKDAPASILYGGSTYKPTGDITLYAIYKRVEGGGGGEGTKATLTFDDTSKRTTLTTEQQVWTENNITLTNDKASSTSDIIDSSNPTRFYKNSKITVSAPETITKIVATTSGGDYTTALVNSVGGGATSDGNTVTITTSASSDTYTIQLTGGQTRLYSITVTYGGGLSTSYYHSTPNCQVTITYYGFGGGYTTDCETDPVIVITKGDTYQIPNCEPTDYDNTLNRTFAGTWNTQANGKGTEYEPGDEFIVNSDITLYAQWKLETTGNITLPADKEDLATTDIVVTGGKTLTIPEGKTITINSLTLKGGLIGDGKSGNYAMPSVWVPKGATLVRKNTTINLDLVVNSKSWYPFAVPFAATINANVEYLEPTLAAASEYGTHFAIKTYDGARRAEEGVDQTNNWVQLNRNEKLQPGVGYIISALTYPNKDTATIRIPMTVDNAWLANGELTTVNEVTRNQVAVTAYTGKASDPNNGGHQRHAGWNFVANPYLANFAGTNASGSFINGEILINNGEYSYGGEDVPYVTIPTYNFAHYNQVRLSEATLSPAYSFFVQVDKSGTMTFETAGRQAAPASIAARNAEERPVKMDVDITLSDNHSSDQTGIIISDRYSEAYEIGRDLEKLFGSAYNLSVYTLMADNTPLAFQALAIRSNMQVIPVGYRAPEQGEYTFRLNEATSSIDLLNEQYEQLVLVDYQTGELTNLLIADYTFYSERTQADNRFAIYAVPRQNAPTDLPNAIGQDKQAQKIIHNGHLYILRDGNVYNGNGQIVK